ncbi:hypothetical protein AGMMS50249_4700 [candidate division SR1 bacterium]|nr:hypothetical protein AGMMS50249_4700 [candidate division SR1 bacterium]
MNTFDTPSFTKNTVKTTELIDQIKSTTDSLMSILDSGTDQIGSYGGQVVQKISGEYVDRLVFALLKLKFHLYRLEREMTKGLIKDDEDLENIISGLQETYDQLGVIMAKDGIIRNSAGYLIDQLRSGIESLKGRINIKIS